MKYNLYIYAEAVDHLWNGSWYVTAVFVAVKFEPYFFDGEQALFKSKQQFDSAKDAREFYQATESLDAILQNEDNYVRIS